MASPRPSTSEMQSLFVEFGLPIEPKPFDEAAVDESCQIVMGYYDDPNLEIIGPIDDEIDELPYHVDGRTTRPDFKLEEGEPVVVVWIEGFFTDGLDFAYYVIGRQYLASFTMGTFNSPAYSGPTIASPIKHFNSELLPRKRTRHGASGIVRRSHGPTGNVKWKYLFETARLAWNRLLIDPEKVRSLRAQNASILLHISRQTATRTEDIEVRSVPSTEAREVEAEMSAKKKGKMKLVEIEEPSSPIVAAHATTTSCDPGPKATSPKVAAHATNPSSDPEPRAPSPPASNKQHEVQEVQLDQDREAHLRRMAGYYAMMKRINPNDKLIRQYLVDMLRNWWSELRVNEAVQKKLDIWTSAFKEHIKQDRELDKAKRDPLNTDQAYTWETDEMLEVLRDGLFASVIDFVEGQMDLQEIEQSTKKLPQATSSAE